MLAILLACMFAGLLFVVSGSLRKSTYNILEKVSSPYGTIWVYEDNSGIRCLSYKHPSITESVQSCMLLDRPLVSMFPYYDMVLSSLYINPTPGNILMIGLGGGVMALQLAHLLPGSDIDVVEINPEMLRLSKKFFMFSESSHIRVIIGDGVPYIVQAARDGKKYDWIILDVFDNDTQETTEHFFNAQLMGDIGTLLSDKGMFSLNTLMRRGGYARAKNAFMAIFDNFYDLGSLSGLNHVLIATNGPKPTIEQIGCNADAWADKFGGIGIDCNQALARFVDS